MAASMIFHISWITTVILICFSVKRVCCLIDLTPETVIQLSNKACVIAVTENAGLKDREDFYFLDDVSFANESSVFLGSVSLSDFTWPSNKQLELARYNDDPITDFSYVNFIIFTRKTTDRTCLLQPTDQRKRPPTAFGYKTSDFLLESINEKCGTYRTKKGLLTMKGLHRQYIHENIFHVHSILDSKNMSTIYQGFLDKEGSCQKGDGECNCAKSHSKNGILNLSLKFPHTTEMAKCERISLPTREEFFHDYLKLSKPVIITDAMKHWPAMARWTNSFLRKNFGERKVHIKLTRSGDYEGVEAASLWENFASFHIPDGVIQKLLYPDLVVVRPATNNMNFSEFLDLMELISGGNLTDISAYLEYSSISQYLPELKDDISEMTFFKDLLKLQHLNFWLSDGNTLGKLHFDPYDNFLCQVSGTKEVIMFEPHNNSRLYEGHIPEAMLSYNEKTGEFRRKSLVDSTSMVMSPVDILKPDMKRFPKFLDTHPLNCTISEGEVLFMPSFWWHEVQSYPSQKEARNLAVNFWYEPFLTKEFPCPECPLDINPKYRQLL
ncbi:hypothetical protein ScPMuIL_015198 [Solemya velum]